MRGEEGGKLPVTCAAFIGCRAPVAEKTIASTDRNNRNNPNKEHMMSWITNLVLQGLKRSLKYQGLRGEFSAFPLSHARVCFHLLSNTPASVGAPGSHLGKPWQEV